METKDIIVYIVEILGILATAILGVLAYRKFILKRNDQIKDNEANKAEFDAIANELTGLYTQSTKIVTRFIIETHNELSKLTAQTSATRAILLAAHNNTGPLSLFSPRYSSALDESVNGVEPVLLTWQNQLLDVPYVQMLERFITQGKMEIDTTTMPDGILKDVYLAGGVKNSLLFMIDYDIQKHRLIYLSVNFSSGIKLTANERVVITNVVTKLKEISKRQRQHYTNVERIKNSLLKRGSVFSDKIKLELDYEDD